MLIKNSNSRNPVLSSLIFREGELYMLSQELVLIGILALFVLLVLLILLSISLRKKSKAEYYAIKTREELDRKCRELEDVSIMNGLQLEELNHKIFELKSSKEKIRRLAYNDSLTELPNRMAVIEMLDNVMKTIRNEEVIAVMDIDLDNFKIINDTLGHSYGDELLIDVTHRLKQIVDENDYLARIGGDEFAIISQNIWDIGEYEDKVKKIQRIFEYPFVLSMKEYFVTVSIGITIAPKDGKSTTILMKNADVAMYAAKENGKNTYFYFNDSLNEKLTSKIQIQSELRKAIEHEEFLLFYQPQIDLNTDKITGMEALIRWNHPTRGILTPIEFIGVAEETGLIVPIGQWVLQEACSQLKQWEIDGYDPIRMAINISVRQFKDKDFVEMVGDIIRQSHVEPNQVELEITESMAFDDMQYTIDTILKLQEIGVMFSLDDFGTGYSSMNYLKQLPVNTLKIDKSFLNTVLDNKDEQCIVETIINLARILKLDVIAEGVEKKEQQDFLKSALCDKAQGYLYSKPLPKHEIEQILQKTK